MITVSTLPKKITVGKIRGQWVRPSNIFNCRIRALRIKNNLGLRTLAKYSGVSVATISRMEWGADCSLANALKLARFFETEVSKIWILKAAANGRKGKQQ